MAEDNRSTYQEDAWDDSKPGKEVIEVPASSTRSEPFLTSEEPVSFAGDAGAGIGFVDPTAGASENQGNQGKQGKPQNAKKAKSGKPMSTAKVMLMAGGGIFVVMIVGATAFWFVSHKGVTSAPMPLAPMARPPMIKENAVHQGQMALPGSPSAMAPAAKPMESVPPVSVAGARSGSVPTKAAGSFSVAPMASMLTPVKPSGSASESSSVPSASHGTMPISASDLSTATTSSSGSTDSMVSSLPNPATQAPEAVMSTGNSKASETSETIAEMAAQIQSLKAKIQSEQAQVENIHENAQAHTAPRVVYRTVVRYVPQHAVAARKPVSGLPDGYALVGGSGDHALIRTPSGSYQTIHAGDTLDGRMVHSVHDGHVMMGK